jgi:hypothetical protein
LSEGSCERPPENYNCNGSWIGDYCGNASACNTGSRAKCEYPESDRVDCDGNNLYCEDSQACNYNKLLSEGSCERPPENYNCNGSWIGAYCGNASACNTGSRKNCEYPESDRVDCDGNNLYCENESACNYDKLGTCSYPKSERVDCDDNPLYCTDPSACNFNEMGSCTYHDSRTDCEGNKLYCDNSKACNIGEMGSCDIPDDGHDCNNILKPVLFNISTNYPIFILNRDINGNYVLEDKEGNAVSKDTLQKYTIKSQQTVSNGFELILYMVIPINFKGIFYIIDGKQDSINNDISNDFICVGQNKSLEVKTTTMVYEKINSDDDGNNIPSHYHLYKITLFNQFENYIIGTKELSEGFTNEADNLLNNDTKLNKLLEIKTDCGSRFDCEGNALFCSDISACNFNELGSCTYHGSREDCEGNPLYCTDPEACNTNEFGSCIYHGSREDCSGNALYCTDPEACNFNEMGSCTYHGSREDCEGNPLYCTDPEACNFNEKGECTYHGSREDCEGNPLYCVDSGEYKRTPCNVGEMGSCQLPEENYNCDGSWVGEYCPPDKEGACNPGERKNCWFPGQKEDKNADFNPRVDCDGNPLYCTDPSACNFNGENGSCIYHGSREDCEGNPLYCTIENAVNYNEMGSCIPGTIENIFGSSLTKSRTTYTLNANFTIDENNKHTFPIEIEDNMTFDGGDKSITYTGTTEWSGLFKTNSDGTVNADGTVTPITFTIKNTTFNLQGANLSANNGCFLAKVTHDKNNITINK